MSAAFRRARWPRRRRGRRRRRGPPAGGAAGGAVSAAHLACVLPMALCVYELSATVDACVPTGRERRRRARR